MSGSATSEQRHQRACGRRAPQPGLCFPLLATGGPATARPGESVSTLSDSSRARRGSPFLLVVIGPALREGARFPSKRRWFPSFPLPLFFSLPDLASQGLHEAVKVLPAYRTGQGDPESLVLGLRSWLGRVVGQASLEPSVVVQALSFGFGLRERLVPTHKVLQRTQDDPERFLCFRDALFHHRPLFHRRSTHGRCHRDYGCHATSGETRGAGPGQSDREGRKSTDDHVISACSCS